jgi:hypothetical protein
MATQTQTDWITAEEYCAEWRRLRELHQPLDSPDTVALLGRLQSRNDELFDRYGKKLIDQYPDKWIAIATDGRVLIRDASYDARVDARDQFGPGNYAVRKLTHGFQGVEIRH